jgi:hypothetical protein
VKYESHLASDLGGLDVDAVPGPVFHLKPARGLLELLQLDPGLDGAGVLAHVWKRRAGAPNGDIATVEIRHSCPTRRRVSHVLMAPGALESVGSVFEVRVQPVEAETFIDREPLLQLRAGQLDVDHRRPALADEGGAADLTGRDPLRDAPWDDAAHFGKFRLADYGQGKNLLFQGQRPLQPQNVLPQGFRGSKQWKQQKPGCTAAGS